MKVQGQIIIEFPTRTQSLLCSGSTAVLIQKLEMQFVSHSLMVMGELLNEGVEMNYLGSDGDPIVFEAPVVRKPTYVLRKVR